MEDKTIKIRVKIYEVGSISRRMKLMAEFNKMFIYFMLSYAAFRLATSANGRLGSIIVGLVFLLIAVINIIVVSLNNKKRDSLIDEICMSLQNDIVDEKTRDELHQKLLDAIYKM